MSYFLKYGLRAKERKEASVDPAEFGTYVHAVLEKTARRVMELGGFRQVSLEETVEIAKAFSEEYARERFSQIDSERISYLFRRNWRELEMVVEELWQELRELAMSTVDGMAARRRKDDNEVCRAVRSAVSSYLYKHTKRSPMIIPMVTKL